MSDMKQARSFATTVLWAFVLLNIVTLMIFTFSVKYEDGERALTSAKTSLSEIVTEKAQLIAVSLKAIESKTENMGDWAEYFLNTEASPEFGAEYFIDPEAGTLTRNAPVGKTKKDYSAVFLPNNVTMTEDIIREISVTEQMDPVFSRMLEQEKMLKWVYTATANEFLRVSPFYELNAFAENHKQTGDTFYKIATWENNPWRKSVWTEPYVDYLGTGWMVTCSHPIYDKDDAFFGVVCADVGIEAIKSKFLEGFKLGESGKIYLLTNEGKIIYHPDYQKKAEKQGELYDKNLLEDDSLGAKKIDVLKQTLQQEDSLIQFVDYGQSKMIAGHRIEGQPWTLIIEINKDEFLSQNRIDGKVLMQLIFIGLMLAGILVTILYYEFSVPMRTLVDGVKIISKGNFRKIQTNTGFLEINLLSEAFNNMNDDLQQYTESILRKNNEISTVLNAIYDVVMIIDAECNVKIANEKSEERILQENRHIHKCYAILGNRKEKCENCVLEQLLNDRQQKERQEIIGGEIYKNTYYPIIEPSGEVKEIVVLSQCITKRMATESELQQIEKMAGIGQFSAAIAHEIKNPLAVIKGAIYIMNTYNRQATPGGTYTEELEMVDNAVKEAEHVIATLLDFSSQETENGCFVDLRKIADQILMISRKEIIKRGIKVDVNLEPETFLYGGKTEHIKIILQNLINNSIQATQGNAVIRIYSKKIEANKILIGVEDNGCGISLQPKSKVFEPFITTKKDVGGTGIGLWITKTLIEDIGGSISLDEARSEGTEIQVILPILEEYSSDCLIVRRPSDV